jgi:hypothetical protein
MGLDNKIVIMIRQVDNIGVISGRMTTFSFSFGVIIWLDHNIGLSIELEDKAGWMMTLSSG